jgi:hypothetical protein
MSEILDIKYRGADMSMQERSAWISILVTLCVPSWYFLHVLGEAGDGPVAEIDYQGLLIWNVGIMIVAMIVAMILSTIGTAIGTAIGTEVAAAARGEKAEPGASEAAVEKAVKRLDRKDERDSHIERLGNSVFGIALSSLVIGPLALAMLEREHFWIANSLYAALVIAGLIAAVVKVVAYRKGL